LNLNGQLVLITGGAVRIGRAIVMELAACKCDVIIHYQESEAKAKALAEEVGALGRKAYTVAGSLGSHDDCLRIIDDAVSAAGRIDVLINNAAVFKKESLLESIDSAVKDEFQVNLFAPMSLTREFASRIKANGSGRGVVGAVVNLVDRRVVGNEIGCMPYLLAKKALVEFTRNAALELAPSITVNAVAPGAILPPPGEGDDVVRELAGEAPLAHQCLPPDVARAVAFLLQADGITGQTLFVDSGQHLLGNSKTGNS
jgi:pteridine reductase